MMHIGRNAPCPCGSGKKYKRCCGAAARSQPVNDVSGIDMLPPGHRWALERQTGRVGKLLSEQEFATVEEMDAFLQEAVASGLLETVEPSSSLERAQDVM